MSNPCLILDIATAEYWQPFKDCRRIDQDARPTVLHPDRETAEKEALRLAQAHPGRRFAVFELMTAALTVSAPTHITLGGKVVEQRSIAHLMTVGEQDLPF